MCIDTTDLIQRDTIFTYDIVLNSIFFNEILLLFLNNRFMENRIASIQTIRFSFSFIVP